MNDEEEDESGMGAVRYPAMPSLVSLQLMRNRLHLAHLGQKLMKWTAMATGKELRRISMSLTVLYKTFGDDLRNAFILLARGRYFFPSMNKIVLENIDEKASVTVGKSSKSVSAVKVLHYYVYESGQEPYEHLGIAKGGQNIHEAKVAWLDLLKRIVLMLELRTSFTLIEEAYMNATKPVDIISMVTEYPNEFQIQDLNELKHADQTLFNISNHIIRNGLNNITDKETQSIISKKITTTDLNNSYSDFLFYNEDSSYVHQNGCTGFNQRQQRPVVVQNLHKINKHCVAHNAFSDIEREGLCNNCKSITKKNACTLNAKQSEDVIEVLNDMLCKSCLSSLLEHKENYACRSREYVSCTKEDIKENNCDVHHDKKNCRKENNHNCAYNIKIQSNESESSTSDSCHVCSSTKHTGKHRHNQKHHQKHHHSKTANENICESCCKETIERKKNVTKSCCATNYSPTNSEIEYQADSSSDISLTKFLCSSCSKVLSDNKPKCHQNSHHTRKHSCVNVHDSKHCPDSLPKNVCDFCTKNISEQTTKLKNRLDDVKKYFANNLKYIKDIDLSLDILYENLCELHIKNAVQHEQHPSKQKCLRKEEFVDLNYIRDKLDGLKIVSNHKLKKCEKHHTEKSHSEKTHSEKKHSEKSHTEKSHPKKCEKPHSEKLHTEKSVTSIDDEKVRELMNELCLQFMHEKKKHSKKLPKVVYGFDDNIPERKSYDLCLSIMNAEKEKVDTIRNKMSNYLLNSSNDVKLCQPCKRRKNNEHKDRSHLEHVNRCDLISKNMKRQSEDEKKSPNNGQCSVLATNNSNYFLNSNKHSVNGSDTMMLFAKDPGVYETVYQQTTKIVRVEKVDGSVQEDVHVTKQVIEKREPNHLNNDITTSAVDGTIKASNQTLENMKSQHIDKNIEKDPQSTNDQSVIEITNNENGKKTAASSSKLNNNPTIGVVIVQNTHIFNTFRKTKSEAITADIFNPIVRYCLSSASLASVNSNSDIRCIYENKSIAPSNDSETQS